MITEHLMRPGTGSIQFNASIPVDVTDRIRSLVDENAGSSAVGASVVVTPTRHDSVELGDSLLDVAIYTGPITERPDRLSVTFAGLSTWLDSMLATGVSHVSGSAATWLGSLLDNGLTAGSIGSVSSVSRTFPAYSCSRREALDVWAQLADAEYVVNPDGSVDVGSESYLFRTAGDSGALIVTRFAEGRDGVLVGVIGDVLDQNVTETGPLVPSSGVVLGSGTGESVLTGSASRSLNGKAFDGSAVEMVRVYSAPSEDDANLNSVAGKNLNLSGAVRKVSVGTANDKIRRLVRPGDVVYLYDPSTGLVDNDADPVVYMGQAIKPLTVRLIEITYPVTPDMGVFIRPNGSDPDWIDVSDWVEPDNGGAKLTVGDWSPMVGPTNRSNPEIEERVAGIAGSWTGVSFANSWSNYGSPYQEVQYRKVGDVVEVRGLARKDATFGSQTVFTLPVGFRPIKDQLWSCIVYGNLGSGAGEYHDRVNVDASDGGVKTSFGSSLASSNWISFHHSFSVT